MLDKNLNILIADDHKTMRGILRNMLAQFGFNHIVEAENDASAWAALQAQAPGLVIASSLALLKRLRADARFKTTPFLLMSADSRPEPMQEATQAGATAYLVKPFDADTLKAKLAGL